MSLRIRHCLECQKCRTRYLIAFSPYANGSQILRSGKGLSEEFHLYCSCGTPPAISRSRSSELRRYSVTQSAYDRGYGSPEEIVSTETVNRTATCSGVKQEMT
jgi:hypothetical protein